VKLPAALVKELVVTPGTPAGLALRDTGGTRTDWLGPLGGRSPRDVADQRLEGFRAELTAAQRVLYASDHRALLLIFQGLDAAGKDGTITHVLSGVNPQGTEVHSFKQPSETELAHDFLWRCAVALPERGRIGIFNRSHYEEVLVVRVHPELLAAERITRPDASLWQERFEDINAFERHLDRSGTTVVKFFLHISEDEQRRRLLERLDQPDKQWKFSPADLAEHGRYGEYQHAYEEALTATSTPWAPWYVVPADHKHAMRALVGGIVVHALEGLHLTMPVPDAAQRVAIKDARRQLGQ
jgi:PPK2 family polyphosphate:nucleotide phosphotransferase